MRLTILPFPRGVSHKGFTTQKTFIQRAFAQFQNIELKLHRYVCDRSGVEDSTVPSELSRIKSYDHSTNVNSTCISTVFKIES